MTEQTTSSDPAVIKTKSKLLLFVPIYIFIYTLTAIWILLDGWLTNFSSVLNLSRIALVCQFRIDLSALLHQQCIHNLFGWVITCKEGKKMGGSGRHQEEDSDPSQG